MSDETTPAPERRTVLDLPALRRTVEQFRAAEKAFEAAITPTTIQLHDEAQAEMAYRFADAGDALLAAAETLERVKAWAQYRNDDPPVLDAKDELQHILAGEDA